MFYHCSLKPLPVGTVLVGLKAAHKNRQRVGQRTVDEVFDSVRKREFPSAPSLFVSLWVTDVYDLSIPRKAFEESPEAQVGYLYEVEPVDGEAYEVEPRWEVEACRLITWSSLKGQELQHKLEELARKFWRPDLVEGPVRDFLCPKGAVILRLVREVKRKDQGST